jgi:16S rRNA A1518/A1519 N6-dimethyltransferase RsmA/KsgA/DIM1 with predicted DNA glycosylase/AP lyase activity
MGVLLEKRNAGACPALFYPLLRALFGSRRKTIKNNLAGFAASRFGKAGGFPAEDMCAEVLAKSGLKGGERAENLGLETFLTLANLLEEYDHYR